MYRFGADYGPMEESVNMGCIKGGRFRESPSKRELVKRGSVCRELSVS
jgi:hypothetical protein